MCDPRRTAAALGKRYNIFPADTAVRPVDMFYKAIVEIGNILFRRVFSGWIYGLLQGICLKKLQQF